MGSSAPGRVSLVVLTWIAISARKLYYAALTERLVMEILHTRRQIPVYSGLLWHRRWG